MGQPPHADRFVLKGALLFILWLAVQPLADVVALMRDRLGPAILQAAALRAI